MTNEQKAAALDMLFAFADRDPETFERPKWSRALMEVCGSKENFAKVLHAAKEVGFMVVNLGAALSGTSLSTELMKLEMEHGE